MKKLLVCLVAMFVCFSLTGCGNSSNNGSTEKLTCTKTETDEEGYKTESTITVNYKDNKVTKVKQEDVETMDESEVELTYSFGSVFTEAFKNIDGIDAKLEKVNNTSIKSIIEIDYTKLDVNAINEALGSMAGDSIYSKSDITLDEFKSSYLEGYTCK